MQDVIKTRVQLSSGRVRIVPVVAAILRVRDVDVMSRPKADVIAMVEALYDVVMERWRLPALTCVVACNVFSNTRGFG